jgi:hypothetical protein
MDGFDEEQGEETLLRRAISILATRFQDKRLWQKVYEARARYCLSWNVMANSNLKSTRESKRNLLWHQLYWLSQPNDDDDTEPEFPKVNLRAYHEDDGTLGRAKLDKVIIRSSDAKTVRQSGEFEVWLNRYYLAARGKYSRPEPWAATIAHEMLHNLGHCHGDVGDGDYGEWQIVVFDKIVENNGLYGAGSNIKCGTRRMSSDTEEGRPG